MREKIRRILQVLLTNDLITISDGSYRWNDEPHLHIFHASINHNANYIFKNKLKKVNTETFVGGCSSQKRDIALIRCLGEFMERFSMLYYDQSSFLYSSYSAISQNALDPFIMNENKNIRNMKFYWRKGVDIFRKKSIYLPTQLTQLYNPKTQKEKHLSSITSSGAAGGFDPDSTLTRCLYELLERDAFLTVYLNKISPPRIKLSSIKNRHIQSLISYCKRYRYDIVVCDITNNLDIPTFVSFIFDASGSIDTISFGAQSNINPQVAILGSIEEAIKSRQWIRDVLGKYNSKHSKIVPNQIDTLENRALYWTLPEIKKNIDFFFKGKEILFEIKNTTPEKNHLKTLLSIFAQNSLDIYYADITDPLFKKLGYYVFKAAVPQLQPLYLNENKKELRKKRLNDVGTFFHTTTKSYNTIPHPFL